MRSFGIFVGCAQVLLVIIEEGVRVSHLAEVLAHERGIKS